MRKYSLTLSVSRLEEIGDKMSGGTKKFRKTETGNCSFESPPVYGKSAERVRV
jgi:hypothetical protein